MANKSYNLPQAGLEDTNDPRLIAARYAYKQQQLQQLQQLQQQQPQQQQQQQQQLQQHHHQQQQPHQNLLYQHQQQHLKKQQQQRDYYYYTKTIRVGNSLQEVMMKSTLNPNAKEFYPSYVRPTRNGCINPVYNILRHTTAAAAAASYGYEKWPNFVIENNYLAPGKYMEEQVHLSIVKNNFSRNGSTNESRSTSYQEFTSLEHVDDSKAAIGESSMDRERKGPAEESVESVWFIDKPANTSKEISIETWRGKESQEPFIKEEFYDTVLPMTDSGDKNNEDEEEHTTVEKNKLKEFRSLTDLNTARKKLIMLYPPKKQPQIIPEGSQESVFETPNPLSYTSDECFLTQNNNADCHEDENVENMLREGKQYYENLENGKSFNELLDVEDASEEFERTAKPSDSRRFEIVMDSNTSKCHDSIVLENLDTENSKFPKEQRDEQKPRRYILRTKEVDIKIIRKHDPSRIRKTNASNISEKSSKLHQVLPPQPTPKEIHLTYFRGRRKSTINSSIVENDPKLLTKTSSISRTKAGKVSNTTAEVKETVKSPTKSAENPYVATGAIPKTRPAPSKPIKEINVPKSIRKQQTTVSEQQPAMKNLRHVTMKENIKKEQEKEQNKELSSSSTARELSSGGSNKRGSSIKSSDYQNTTSLVPRYTSLLRNVNNQKNTASTKFDSNANASKPLTSILVNNAISLAKKDTTAVAIKERVVHKSIIKTQMRSSANVSPGSKSICSPRKDTESKKEKAYIMNRNLSAKSAKSVVASKIPIKPKSSPLKTVKDVIGSDGDNVKITESKSCATLWNHAHKNLTKKNSETICRVGDKASESKKKTIPRDTAHSGIRNSTIKKHSLAPN